MSGLKNLVWLTQLGFSIISPLLVCIFGAVWLREQFQWGAWIVIVGLFLGLGGAFSAGVTFFRYTKHITKPEKKTPPVSFNEHE